jgi:hypothetical protein
LSTGGRNPGGTADSCFPTATIIPPGHAGFPSSRGIRGSSVGFGIATGSPATSALLTAQGRDVTVAPEMLVPSAEQARRRPTTLPVRRVMGDGGW